MTVSAKIRRKYINVENRPSYQVIGKEFGVTRMVAYYALNGYKGIGRGFGALTKKRRKEIARMGGLKTVELGVGHRFTSEEAKEAVKKRDQKRRLTAK